MNEHLLLLVACARSAWSALYSCRLYLLLAANLKGWWHGMRKGVIARAGLRRLNLEGSLDFNDSTLLELTLLQGLTHLDVSECPELSPGALSTLRQRMPPTCAIYSATS